uniref:Uncharacterized protein n=1 Tax=Pundamilia nyererei TaxID=303518 RepID=A0A3B4F7A5_9CICH
MGNTNQTSKKNSKKKKVRKHFVMDTEDEEEGGNEREFDEPLCALVKNCNMLHNIVGPACIFLRQGFAQSQIMITRPDT